MIQAILTNITSLCRKTELMSTVNTQHTYIGACSVASVEYKRTYRGSYNVMIVFTTPLVRTISKVQMSTVNTGLHRCLFSSQFGDL